MEKRCEELSKMLAGGLSRRECLRRLGGGLTGAMLASLVPREAWGDPGQAMGAKGLSFTSYQLGENFNPFGSTLANSVYGSRTSNGVDEPALIFDAVKNPSVVFPLPLPPGSVSAFASAAYDFTPDVTRIFMNAQMPDKTSQVFCCDVDKLQSKVIKTANITPPGTNNMLVYATNKLGVRVGSLLPSGNAGTFPFVQTTDGKVTILDGVPPLSYASSISDRGRAVGGAFSQDFKGIEAWEIKWGGNPRTDMYLLPVAAGGEAAAATVSILDWFLFTEYNNGVGRAKIANLTGAKYDVTPSDWTQSFSLGIATNGFVTIAESPVAPH